MTTALSGGPRKSPVVVIPGPWKGVASQCAPEAPNRIPHFAEPARPSSPALRSAPGRAATHAAAFSLLVHEISEAATRTATAWLVTGRAARDLTVAFSLASCSPIALR